ERLREIFDGARILAKLRSGQPAAPVDGFQRFPRLQIAIERLDDLLKTAQPEQGLRPQALRQRVVIAQRESRVERGQGFGVLPASQQETPLFHEVVNFVWAIAGFPLDGLVEVT